MRKTCRECGSDISASKKPEATFCSTECKQDFNNRRAKRGAEMYDLFMAMRYERPLAKSLKLFAILCGLAHRYRDEDGRKRCRGWTPAKCWPAIPRGPRSRRGYDDDEQSTCFRMACGRAADP